MSMRGFSTIELLIAFTILVSTILAVVVSIFGINPLLKNAELERGAYAKAASILSRARAFSFIDFNATVYATSTSDGTYQTETHTTFLDEDDLVVRMEVTVGWKNVWGELRETSLDTVITNPNAPKERSFCDPFLTGDWAHTLTVSSHSLTQGDLLTSSIPIDSYPVSDLAVTKGILAVSVQNTKLTTSPTLFLFSLSSPTSSPVLLSTGFDNSVTSTVGFAALATSRDLVYAANGFGSASPVTCSTAVNCAQLQIFSTSSTRVGSLMLSTSSLPFAITAASSTAPAHAVTYKNNYVYLGLQKTLSGDEFNIIDVTDPTHPLWKGGAHIGRTVNSIHVYRERAYVATDDNTQELMVYDIRNATNPMLLGTWNAPGSNGFGFGTAIRVQNNLAYFGRSYVGNAPELYALSIASDTPTVLGSNDIGTGLHPASVVGILMRSFLTFVLTNTSLITFTEAPNSPLSQYREDISFSDGERATALACYVNTLYVGGSNNATGQGFITSITSL